MRTRQTPFFTEQDRRAAAERIRRNPTPKDRLAIIASQSVGPYRGDPEALRYIILAGIIYLRQLEPAYQP